MSKISKVRSSCAYLKVYAASLRYLRGKIEILVVASGFLTESRLHESSWLSPHLLIKYCLWGDCWRRPCYLGCGMRRIFVPRLSQVDQRVDRCGPNNYRCWSDHWFFSSEFIPQSSSAGIRRKNSEKWKIGQTMSRLFSIFSSHPSFFLKTHNAFFFVLHATLSPVYCNKSVDFKGNSGRRRGHRQREDCPSLRYGTKRNTVCTLSFSEKKKRRKGLGWAMVFTRLWYQATQTQFHQISCRDWKKTSDVFCADNWMCG